MLYKMSFIDKLNSTYSLLSKLDDIIIKDSENSHIKNHLLSVSEDLSSYKDINNKNIQLENEAIKSQIIDVLNKINKIETNVKNKLIITEKYTSYLKT